MLPFFCCAFGGLCNRYALIPATQPKGFSPAAIPVSLDHRPYFFHRRSRGGRLRVLPARSSPPSGSLCFRSVRCLSIAASPSPSFKPFPAFRFLFASFSLPNFPFCYLLFLPPPFPFGYPVAVHLGRIDSTCPVESKSNRCRRGSGGGIERSEKA